MGIKAQRSVEETTLAPFASALTKSPGTQSHEIALAAIEAALGQKARDVRGLDLRGISDIADFFVVASGNSDRHVKGIADRVLEGLEAQGEEPDAIAGYENAEWIVLDYGNVIVHLFYEPLRHFYNLDELWRAGTPVELPEQLAKEAKLLRTGMFA